MRAPVNTTLPPLAIVGFSLKFPQDAISPESFWRMIVEGRCASTEFPPDRLSIDAHYHPDSNRLDTISVRGGHFMAEEISRFDAPFFSITAAEAEAMDPQQRLVLETTYRALENAGLAMASVAKSKTSVFVGSFGHDYSSLQLKDPLTMSKWNATGTSMNMQSNRVSWFFDLAGPSATVDTACSSSLMAIDMACQSIWSGDSTMGLAIGSNAILALETGLSLDNLGLLSSDSRCYSFDRRGNGYARGEGVGVLVIRPLEAALRNGDTIRSVIRSSASNQDGRTPGITQPSMERQEKLIRDTYRKGGLDLAMTRYFEAHGTGTAVGDPTEVKAIGSIFRRYRSPEDPLYIGSVKSNIGHLEGASGIAGVIKTILALEKGVIPPNSANFKDLNPRIDDDFWHIKIPREAVPWPVSGLRRASVSSFGFGGSNSHIVLDDAYHFLQLQGLHGNHNTVPSTDNVDVDDMIDCIKPFPNRITVDGSGEFNQDSPKLLVWSSTDETGISRIQDKWRPFFTSVSLPDEMRSEYLNNLAYTLAKRRDQFPWRTFVVARPHDDWNGFADRFMPISRPTSSHNLAMIFSGQGSQWYGMGRELIHTYPVFYESIKQADDYLQSLGCDWNIIDELQRPERESKVNETEYSQTLCTALQVALVDLLRDWNIMPRAVVGHSSGEIAAAYSSGAISRQSAWKVAYYRGRLSGKLERFSRTKGSMLAVAVSKEDAASYLDDLADDVDLLRLNVACINSPKSVTISGEEGQIDALKERLDKTDVFSRKLKVRVAYHSFQMHEIAAHYQAAIGTLEKGTAAGKDCPEMVSSVTGNWIKPDDMLESGYWVRNMVSPVLFADAVLKLCSESLQDPPKKLDGSHRRRLPIDHLLEVGPHSVLQGPCKDILKTVSRERSTQYASVLVRNMPAVDTSLTAVGKLHMAGYSINLSRANRDGSRPGRDFLKCLPDLPEYPFNHTKSYWHESHISKNHRLRNVGRVDLIGVPDLNWNALEPRWRNIIRTTELTWVQDHKISDTVVYPASGMLAMAIEGSKQIANSSKKIAAFNINDAAFNAAIRVPSGSDGVETNVYMRPLKDRDAKGSSWFDFRIYTYQSEQWTENCVGSIEVVYSSESHHNANDKELKQEILEYQIQTYSDAKSACTKAMDKASLYQFLARSGYGYGDMFQLIDILNYNHKNHSQIDAKVQSFWSKNGETIHPTTLDAIFQTAIWTATDPGVDTVPTMIPTHVDNLWIDNSGLQTLPGSFDVHTTMRQSDTSAFVTVFDQGTHKALLTIEGLSMSAVSSNEWVKHVDTTTENLCHQIEWKPDITLLSNEEITQLCQQEYTGWNEPVDIHMEVDFLLTARLLQTLDTFSKADFEPRRPHLRKYFDWMLYRQRLLEDGKVEYSFEPWRSRLNDLAFIEEVEKRVLNVGGQGYFVATVAQKLPKFLTGEIDPLNFLFEGSMMKDFYYEWFNNSHGLKRFGKYLDLMAHHNPKMKVIEIGAGTGSMTDILLRTLGRDGGVTNYRRYARWDYTDISRAFFGNAETEFREEGDRMVFSTLDIEQEPEAQGFECGTYDMVVASMVFHATSNLKTTLTHARKLLKPGGKLILYELTFPEVIRTAFIFGLLEGWWLGSEPYRQLSPGVDANKWHELLQQTGFTGLDIVLQDYQDPRCHEDSLLVSTAIDYSPSVPPLRDIEIVYDSVDEKQRQFAYALAKECEVMTDSFIRSCSIEEAAKTPNDELLRVFLLELDQPLLCDIDPERFEQLKTLLASTTAHSLWVNQAGDLSTPHPHFRLVDGMLRVLMEEDDRRRCFLLSLESSDNFTQQTQVMKLIRTLQSSSKNDIDTEYVQHDGLLHIGRLVPAWEVNEAVSLRTNPQQEKLQAFGCGIPLKLNATSPALLNGLEFVEDASMALPLLPDEIEVEVKCTGVNFRDVLIAVGQLKSPYTGFECSGIVTRVGENCHWFQPGDLVAALHSACYASFIRLRETDPVVKVPQNLSFVDAAAIPVNFATAHIALIEIARLEPGQSVLIHSGAGGTGQAAIQIAKSIGANIFTTVGSNEKKQFLIDAYDIPKTHIFSSRSPLFAKAIRLRTNNRGVDVILNSLAGENLFASWDCIAPYGRFVEIGKKDILSNNKLPMKPFDNNVTFSVVDLSSMVLERPDICLSALESVFTMAANAKVQAALPLTVYGVGQMEKAFRSMQSGKHLGKLVIEMRKQDQVLTQLAAKHKYSLDPRSTFVVCGGFGGLGKNIACWLAHRGARHLLLLSRSGGNTQNARALIDELEEKNVQVMAPACDVADEVCLQQVLDDCRCTMPPIKGCIQAAMVIRDTFFEGISPQLWHESISPKVQGTWNLHKYLPSGLDFFIMLSSISGIVGMKAQANYAAANSFLDALSKHRITLGEKATSLDLGVMAFTGAVADNAKLQERLIVNLGFDPVTEPALHALLDYYCDPHLPPRTSFNCQTTVGISPSATRQCIDERTWLNRPLFRQLSLEYSSRTSTPTRSDVASVTALLQQAQSLADVSSIVTDALTAKLSRALSIPVAEIDASKPLHQYGVDSLVAVELRSWFSKELQADIAVFDILGSATVTSVGQLAMSKSKLRGESWSK